MKLAGGYHRDNMSTKDAVGNGNAAMKEAAMKSLSTEAADNAESSARRAARAGARREPCMLIGHSSTRVGLEPGSIGKETDYQAVRAGPGMASWWRVRAAPPWIRQRLWWEQVRPDRPSPALPAAYGDGVSRS